MGPRPFRRSRSRSRSSKRHPEAPQAVGPSLPPGPKAASHQATGQAHVRACPAGGTREPLPGPASACRRLSSPRWQVSPARPRRSWRRRGLRPHGTGLGSGHWASRPLVLAQPGMGTTFRVTPSTVLSEGGQKARGETGCPPHSGGARTQAEPGPPRKSPHRETDDLSVPSQALSSAQNRVPKMRPSRVGWPPPELGECPVPRLLNGPALLQKPPQMPPPNLTTPI